MSSVLNPLVTTVLKYKLNVTQNTQPFLDLSKYKDEEDNEVPAVLAEAAEAYHIVRQKQLKLAEEELVAKAKLIEELKNFETKRVVMQDHGKRVSLTTKETIVPEEKEITEIINQKYKNYRDKVFKNNFDAKKLSEESAQKFLPKEVFETLFTESFDLESLLKLLELDLISYKDLTKEELNPETNKLEKRFLISAEQASTIQYAEWKPKAVKAKATKK